MNHKASKEEQPIIITTVANPQPSSPSVPNWLSEGRNLAVGVAVGVVLTLVGTHLSSQPKQVSTPAPPTLTEAPAYGVTVAPVEITPVERKIEATGTVTASELIPVLSQATGLQIQEVLAEEGEWVEESQLLARLDDSVLQAQLAQAQASVAQAQARLQELKAGSRSEEIARAEAQVKSAQAAVEQAQSDLDLAQTRSQRYQTLKAQGAIAQDRLDEVINKARSQETALKQAQASLREAEQELAQLRSGPRSEVIAGARAQLAQAQAQEQLVRAQLKDTRVVAPVRGKIVTRNARVGDLSSPSQKLFEIIEDGRLELTLKVPETQLKSIRQGQKVEITSDTDSKLKLEGEVREIDPAVDEESRQATVKVELSSRDLKPGMFMRGSIITASEASLTVPASAILPQTDGSGIVYVLENDTVKARSVETGEILPNERVEIQSGLERGERVIVKGVAYLKEGDRVKVVAN